MPKRHVTYATRVCKKRKSPPAMPLRDVAPIDAREDIFVKMSVMPIVHAIIDTEIEKATRKIAKEHEPLATEETIDPDDLSDPEVISILSGEFAP